MRPRTEQDLEDADVLDRAADILEDSPELQLIGAALPTRLRGLAALVRGQPTQPGGTA